MPVNFGAYQQWLETHQQQLQDEYVGQWIAINEKGVYASADTLDAIYDEAEKQGVRVPFIMKVKRVKKPRKDNDSSSNGNSPGRRKRRSGVIQPKPICTCRMDTCLDPVCDHSTSGCQAGVLLDLSCPVHGQ